MTMLPKKTDKSRKYSASLVNVGVDTVKDQLFAWMEVDRPGNVGYMHFPNTPDYNHEHFLQLTAEVLVGKMRGGNMIYEYKKIRPRNEALDLSVYNRAALDLLRLDLNKMADQGQCVTWNPSVPIVKKAAPKQQRSRGFKL